MRRERERENSWNSERTELEQQRHSTLITLNEQIIKQQQHSWDHFSIPKVRQISKSSVRYSQHSRFLLQWVMLFAKKVVGYE